MIKFTTNLEAIGEITGAISGLAEGIEDDAYLESLIQKAHGIASNEFDLTAAATAGAGYLSHVYEFGTAGITRGPVRFPDPTSPAARLWVHHLGGRGGQQNISFAFRPAMAPNPQPTTATTGVASKTLRKLSRRKYIFRNKAWVMETGQEVKITPRHGNLLFVPFYAGGSKGNPFNQRGFQMYPFNASGKPIITVPGRDSQGTFTAFWTSWWNARGGPLMTQSLERDVTKDTAEILEQAVNRAQTAAMEPTAMANIQSTAVKSKAAAKSAMIRKTNLRRRRQAR